MPKLTKNDDDIEAAARENPPPYSPVSQPAVEAPEQQPENSAAQAARGERPPRQPRGEQSQPSGRQDATLPGSTPETSSQMPEPGKSTDKGKSPLKFDPNAPAVDTVAQKKGMRVEGELDHDKSQQRQIHSSALPPERGPEAAWEDQIIPAAQGAYPRLRLGVDYEVGRKEWDAPPELLGVAEGVDVDFEKIKKAAEKLAGQNPYAGYQPKPPLHGGFAPQGTQGEVSPRDVERQGGDPNRILPGNVAQSEVNPKTNEKVPSQAYPPPPPVDVPPSQSGAPPAPEGPAPESQL